MIHISSQVTNPKSDHQEYLDIAIQATGICTWDWQVQTGKISFNQSLAEIVGYHADELPEADLIEIIDYTTDEFSQAHLTFLSNYLHLDDFKKAYNLLTQHLNDELVPYKAEIRLKHKLGHYIWVQASGKLIERNEEGKPTRMIGTLLNITEHKDNEAKMSLHTQLLKESEHVARLGGWKLNLKNKKLFWTDETYRLHDTSPEDFDPSEDASLEYYLPDSKEILTQAVEKAISQGIGYDLELETYTFKGRKIDIRATCSVTLEQGVPVSLTGIFQDISIQKNNQRELQKSLLDLAKVNEALKLSAHYDSLTGLPNRNLLTDKIAHAVAKSLLNKTFVAIAFIDLDGFQQINDMHGHNIGDELLKIIANKLKGVLQEGDTLSRFGGDEFVVVINNLSAPSDSELIVSNMLKSISGILQIQDKLLSITASIGLTFSPLDAASPNQLLRHADQAMYKAKQQGKNRSHIFDIEKDVALKYRNEKLKRIAQALKNDEFVLYYQPKVDLRTHELVGVEALIRWDHPDQGMLPPIMFLPTIEHDILDIEIGNWVIKTALQQSQNWLSAGYNIPISVNISPMHLQYTGFVRDLENALNQHPNFKPESIEFEILESSALTNIELVSNVMKECDKLGVRFSIDDFGTGYSSLTYLKRLPANYLKIDQSFVRDMLVDNNDKAIVQGIVELAKVFNLKVIAEGVETPEHGELLLSLGSYIAQGYAIAKPMPANEILHWLAQWGEKPILVDRSS